MFQEICVNILNEKWANVEQIGFPLNAKKVAAMECFSSSIRQFFFAEINYYCNCILKALITNTNASEQLLHNEDGEHLISILYDWIEFNKEQTHLILENAIQTDLFFLLNPAKCLSMFLYRKNGNIIDERKIDEMVKELEFITDTQNIVNSLTNELLELANTKNTLSDTEFSSLANDVVFNVIQGMEITDLLSPFRIIQEILCNENIPIALIDMFFYEHDLSGILTKIKEYAINNEKESLTYNEILEIINGTLGIEKSEAIEETKTNEIQYEQENIAENTDENITENVISITNIDVPDVFEEYVENIENEVDNILNKIDTNENRNQIEQSTEIENIDENIIEIDNEQLPIVEETNTTTTEITTDIDTEAFATERIPQPESILDIIVKMRTENLPPIEIETAYLKMENEFLINLKTKFLN